MVILKHLTSVPKFNTIRYRSGHVVDRASLCPSYVIVPHELISRLSPKFILYKPSPFVKSSIMYECLRERNAVK